MAYNETTAIRIRNIFYEKDIAFTEKKMFGGICFMVNDKMCLGILIDKKSNEELLMCRMSENDAENCLETENCIPMQFTGKPMKGYVYVLEKSYQYEKDLSYYIQLCLYFNPVAKKSKKK
jgi:hypothetical protein